MTGDETLPSPAAPISINIEGEKLHLYLPNAFFRDKSDEKLDSDTVMSISLLIHIKKSLTNDCRDDDDCGCGGGDKYGGKKRYC